ncbi:potassium channel family protein [Metamycoplasma auris]|uniref:Trk system potassium uptake protein TrkA n=1 Tax=Metamycoplasma auris TaxID=51363 RepID=A0A2W7G1Y6_9BACT|nr:TrkA family potassium uptake protein [Metamycoplasma auris]PZW00612.1 trk system potassium uptake protein TrkA [Metamycoplasma auris]
MGLFKRAREICIIGIGRFGQAIVKKLISDSTNDIRLVLIDNDEHNLIQFKDEVDAVYVADCADIKTLETLNIKEFDVVIVATPNNIEIVSALLELGVETIIARSLNSRHARILKQIGITQTISPEEEAGKKVAIMVSDNSLTHFSEDIVEIRDGYVSTTTSIKNPTIINKNISELPFRDEYNVLISLIQRDKKTFLPSGDFVLRENDMITFIGTLRNIIEVTEFCTKTKKSNKK